MLNQVIEREGTHVSPCHLKEFQLIPGTAEAVRAMRQHLGALVIVATNQPDLQRGKLAPEELEQMHAFLQQQIEIDDLLICPHSQDGCGCRKPEPGMLLKAADRWAIDLSRSFMIGDSWKDIEAGNRADCTTILLKQSYNAGLKADHAVGSLNEAVLLMARLWEERRENIR